MLNPSSAGAGKNTKNKYAHKGHREDRGNAADKTAQAKIAQEHERHAEGRNHKTQRRLPNKDAFGFVSMRLDARFSEPGQLRFEEGCERLKFLADLHGSDF